MVSLKEKYAVGSGWNRILADLETFLTFFLIFGPKPHVPMDKNRLSHNALTRRIDPRYPEGPWIFFYGESRFWDFEFSRSWAHGPRAQRPGPLWDARNADNSRNSPTLHPNPRLGRDKPVVETPHWDMPRGSPLFLLVRLVQFLLRVPGELS